MLKPVNTHTRNEWQHRSSTDVAAMHAARFPIRVTEFAEDPTLLHSTPVGVDAGLVPGEDAVFVRAREFHRIYDSDAVAGRVPKTNPTCPC